MTEDRVELKVAAHDWQERFIVRVCFESTVVGGVTTSILNLIKRDNKYT